MVKTVIGVLIGVGIGVACRWFDVPVPAPPRLMGAILVLSLTTGYVATDRFLEGRAGTAVERPAEASTGTDVAAGHVVGDEEARPAAGPDDGGQPGDA